MQEKQSEKISGTIPVEHAGLAEHEQNAFRSLEQARIALDQLARERARMKMSNSRVTGIAKEIKELLKVFAIAVY